MRTGPFIYFCIRNYIGTQGEGCLQLIIFLNSPVVYATDRSKVVVPVLFFNSVLLCGLCYVALLVLKSGLVL